MIDESAWVAIAFVVFIAFVWKKVGASMAAMFDQRTEEIRKTLDDARRLRDDAQAELTKYQRLNREALEQAEQITDNAKVIADKIRDDAAAAAEVAIKRKQDQAEIKIKAIEAEVIAELRNRAAELSTAAAGALIKEKLDGNAAIKLVKSDIDRIKKLG
jgi:F-type H+-transporting ATPase subunit b